MGIEKTRREIEVIPSEPMPAHNPEPAPATEPAAVPAEEPVEVPA